MTYFGKICDKHPEVGGLRLPKTGRCVECHKNTTRIGARKRHENRKNEVVTFYGGCCARCGEKDIDVLAIDHIAQDGSLHRESLGKGKGGRSIGSSAVYRWIQANGFPNGFRVLCFNCNMKTYLEHIRANREIP